MQASLQTGVPQPASPNPGHPFSGGMWTAKPWLLAAASVSAVVFAAYGFWQRQEINQLRQTIGQLSKQQTHQPISGQPNLAASKTDAPTSTSLEGIQSPENQKPSVASDSKGALPLQRDTVYITHYVASPSRSRSVPPEERLVERSETPVDQHYAATNRALTPKAQANQSDNVTHNPKVDAYDINSTSDKTLNNNRSVTSRKNNSSPDNAVISPNRVAIDRQTKAQASDRLNKKTGVFEGQQDEKNQVAGRVNETIRDTKSTPSYPTNMVDNATSDVAKSAPVQLETSTETSALSANFELVNSRPLSTKKVNWNALVAQRSRRMQPARTISVVPVVEPTKAPTSQPVQRLTSRFRAGVGGEIASHLLTAGVFTEALVGKHLTVGVGLSQTTYSGTFINDYDFDVQTRRDFRKEFAPRIDPRRDILNINTHTVRLQIPISLGYRIPLTQTLSLLPSIGTSLNLSSSENVTYYCPVFMPQQRGFDEFKTPGSGRNIALINSFALGAGLEWQHRHWVVQTSPILTLPTQSEYDPNWQNNTTVGLRARVLYQF